MKKVIILSMFVSQVLFAVNMDKQRMKKSTNNSLVTKNSFSSSFETSATRYNLDIDGSLFNRSVNYDILEGTLGLSYNVEDWIFSTYGKGVITELKTNSFVALTGASDDADIDRKELIVAITYKQPLLENRNEKSNLFYNLMYFNSELDAQNSYIISDSLNKKYNYKTQGINASATYNFDPTGYGSEFFTRFGILYTQADLDFKEYKNTIEQDRYVNDSIDTWGISLAAGYSYQINNNLVLNTLVDWNYLDFGDINIEEKNQGVLSQNTFTENTLSLRFGLNYRFDSH